jgi:hypothetical protein
MRALCLLCVFHGVQSTALKGRLHKAQPSKEVALTLDHFFAAKSVEVSSSAQALEAPVFVVQGFLAHNTTGKAAVSTAGQHKHLAQNDGDSSVKDQCTQACGKGVDSSCVPECQVRLYACADYDRKTAEGAEKYRECEKQVLSTYSRFAKDWESTHPYLTDLMLRQVVSAADVDKAHDECTAACGKGVDSSCVPECQVKLYTCLDHDRKVPEGLEKHKKCEKEVLDNYRNFAADWEATHPYLLAIGRHASAKDLRSIRDKCVTDCGSGSKKSCAPRCQTTSYTCLHIDATEESDKYKICADGVKSAVAKLEAASSSAAEELAAVDKACTTACGLGLDASCEPECEVQMYGCIENSNAQQYTDCTRKVIQRYEKFASDWNTAHSHLLARRGHADAELLEELHEGCADACGNGVDSSCVPECQAKLYSCLDHDRKTEDGAKKYKQCKGDVLAKYEKFADDWDATHPYLLAVRRHVASAELVRIEDKCIGACGKNVDSSCVPGCQVEMYSCLDHDRKTDEGAKLYEECESSVISEYSKFGATWDAAHPY